MMDTIKNWLSGRRIEREEERNREIANLQGDVRDSIQVAQSSQRILQTMSGVIELNRRSPSQ